MLRHTLIADVLTTVSAVEIDLLLGVGGAYFVRWLISAGGFDHSLI